MTFKPPYWYHDNVEFSYDDLKELKFDIDFIGSEKYAKENQHISTYFLKENLRPDKKYNDLYSTIVRNIVENVGVYDKVKYDCTYWTQLYEKGMKHRPHHLQRPEKLDLARHPTTESVEIGGRGHQCTWNLLLDRQI